MKFTIERAILRESIKLVGKAVSSRTTLDILKGILIEVKDDKIKFVGNNLELGIECYVSDGIEIIEQGAFVLTYKLLNDIVSKLTDDIVSFETIKGNVVKLICGSAEFELKAELGELFPKVSDVGEGTSFTMNSKVLNTMINKVKNSIGTDETKPVLVGGLLEIRDNKLRIVALNGYHVSYAFDYIEFNEDIQAIIPAKSLNEIAGAVGNKEEVKISVTDKHCLVETGNVRLVTRLIDGNYPNYEGFFTNQAKTSFTCNRVELVDVLQRTALVSTGEKNMVRLIFKNDKVLFRASSELGNAKEEISAKVDGDCFIIGFNATYLINGIKGLESEEITVNLTSSINPAIITPSEASEENFKYLVLPVRIQEGQYLEDEIELNS